MFLLLLRWVAILDSGHDGDDGDDDDHPVDDDVEEARLIRNGEGPLHNHNIHPWSNSYTQHGKTADWRSHTPKLSNATFFEMCLQVHAHLFIVHTVTSN